MIGSRELPANQDNQDQGETEKPTHVALLETTTTGFGFILFGVPASERSAFY
jgi:hypothetical protein